MKQQISIPNCMHRANVRKVTNLWGKSITFDMGTDALIAAERKCRIFADGLRIAIHDMPLGAGNYDKPMTEIARGEIRAMIEELRALYRQVNGGIDL